MTPSRFALWHLEQEARGLLSRLGRVRSFALQETMVPAASLSVEAQAAIERFLAGGRRALRERVRRFLAWIGTPAARSGSPADAQRRFTLLRLRFNVVLSHFDIFSEALSQRSEAESGVWLAGLDVAARDALELPGVMEAPPVICYLARGPGAAIRRARTRLPGGAANPVAIIRMPRERMVGSGIASSLVHEVGHQGAALLDLVPSLRDALPSPTGAWAWWRLWISEIVADLWSVSRLGAASTVGLIGVVSLPPPFVFRIAPGDPHPPPYLRVKLSAAIGDALYPHPQWRRLAAMWESFYDIGRLAPERRRVYAELESSLPEFVALLIGHRAPRLEGRSLAEALRGGDRQPARMAQAFASWQERPALLRRAAPTLAFAVLGQARLDGQLEPEDEGDLVASLLRHWAWRATVDVSEVCAAVRRPAVAPPTPLFTVVPRLAGDLRT